MWNSVLAGIVFQHNNVEKLRRELARNGQLREMCGFFGKLPPAWVYTRFLKKLLKHTEEIDEIFEKLVEQLQELLPDFSKHLALRTAKLSHPLPRGRMVIRPRMADGIRMPIMGKKSTGARTKTVTPGKRS